VGDGIDALFDAHYLSLVRLAVQLVDDVETAEDAVQDVFAAFDASTELTAPKQYLQTAVVNRCRSVLRRRGVARAVWSRRARDLHAEPADASAVLEAERGRVLRAIGRLPIRQREVVVLRYYEDLSISEIAQLLNSSNSAVSSALSRALDALTPLLGGNDE
jgi:RNA polymerase sigma factor (sigma-70 family)